MSVTIYDIAKHSNVSISTVSKVLNGRKGVSDAVRLKVLQIAEKLGYFPYLKARETGLFRKKAKYIAEIFGYVNPFLTDQIKKGISNILLNSNFYEINFSLKNIRRDEDKLKLFFEHSLRDNDIAGLIVSFLNIDDKTINEFVKLNIPIILINSKSDITTSLITDEKLSAFKLTEYLIKRGCKNIGFITPSVESASVWKERLEGYKEALEKNNISYNPDLIENEDYFEIENIKLVTNYLIENNKNIDALIYASDWQAYGGINFLKEKKIKIPENISIAGFDNLEFSKIITPSLTTVEQPLFKMGEDAANLLIRNIDKNIKKKIITYNTQIIVRDSTI